MLEVPLSLSWLYFRLASFDRVTQLVEYFLDMEEVVGSSPIVITTSPLLLSTYPSTLFT